MTHSRAVCTDRDPDTLLWAACQSGVGEAFDILFRRHNGRVYLYCARLAGSTEDAEDSAAEAFIELWRGRRKYVPYNGSLVPILLAIAKRLVQKQHRSNSRRRAAHIRLEAQSNDQVSCSDVQVVERLELNDRLAWLARQVGELPPQQRDVVHLCIYGEVPQPEVAEILQIPIGTVKSRLFQARQQLSAAAGSLQLSDSTGAK